MKFPHCGISSPKLSRYFFFHRHKERKKNHKTANLVEKSSEIGGVFEVFWFRQILILTLITFMSRTDMKPSKGEKKFDSETFIQHYYVIIIFVIEQRSFELIEF